MRRIGLAALIAALGLSSTAATFGAFDFGVVRDALLGLQAFATFGVIGPLGASSTSSIDAATAGADPRKLVKLASSLRARVVTASANAGPNIDMMALWPNDTNPTYLIACNEEGSAQPGLQRIRIADGSVETILTGTVSCDPVRRTAWGTIVFGEENGSNGHLFELLHPLETTGVVYDPITRAVTNGATGVGAENVGEQRAPGRLSFEGLALYPNGVLYYGDENRPSRGTAGGAYFKFVPSTPWTGGEAITSLDQSPLADGRIFGLRLGKRSANTDFGQGSNTGKGTWIEVVPAFDADLRAVSATLKLTGYYRPEDAEVDVAALAEGSVRFCGNNTGNEVDDRNFGEMVCVSDGSVEESLANTATPELQLLVVGTPELAMMDNIAYQPGRGNWILHEDGDGPGVGRNNDLWDCLDDREDADLLSDGCVRIATLNDLNAEWTGGIFDATGRRLFVSVQHNVTGHGVVLELNGWR